MKSLTVASESKLPAAPVSAGKREREFFDELVADHGDFNPFMDRGWATLARRFEEWVTPQRLLKLLDIGCGTGQSRQLYLRHTACYTGVDLSAGAIEVAQRRFPDSSWLVGDASRLPFAAETFDVVAFSSVLHHVPGYPAAVREGWRVLRPGGAAFAFDPNVLHPAMALFRHPQSPLYLSQGVSPNERPLAPWSLRRAFGDAGFIELKQRGQSDIPYRAVAPRLLNAILGLYNIGDWCFEHVGLGRWFGTFVVTCGRKPG